jgi:hypothetical protein
MARESSSSAALRFGAIFGVGWGVLLTLNYYFVHVQGLRLTSVVALVLSLVVYLVAGILAASRTGLVSTGLLAGLWTGLFSSLVDAVGVIGILLTDHAVVVQMRRAAQSVAARSASGTVPNITDRLVIISAILGLILGLIVATAIGLGMGALGGLIGKSRAPELQAYQESMYQGMPPASPWQGPGAPPPPASPSQNPPPRQQ